MAQGLRRHLSFANVTSLMALVFAMGGTSYALTLPKNSVGSKQIRKNAVTGAKVKTRSLRASDFALGQLPRGAPGAPGAAGATGLAGPAGAKGEQGVQGLRGVVGAVTVQRTDFGLDDGQAVGTSVPCPTGTRAIGGGSSTDAVSFAASEGIALTVSRPDRTGVTPLAGETFTGWRVAYRNAAGGGDTTVHAFAVCAED